MTVKPPKADLAGEPAERDYSIAVLDRALDVLELLAATAEPIGVTEIARQVGATKSATWRILFNLDARGYVDKDADSGRYTIGARFSELGIRHGSRASLVQFAHPHLEWLARTFGETANLAVIEGGQVLYIDIVESPHDLRLAARVGARDAVHSTALGKAILAFLPEDEIDRALAGPLTPRTPQTVTDPTRIRAELEQVRASGIAVEFGQNEIAASCLGVPVFGPNGEVIAAVSVSGPETRMATTETDRIREALLSTGEAVTKRIGGRWAVGAQHEKEQD